MDYILSNFENSGNRYKDVSKKVSKQQIWLTKCRIGNTISINTNLKETEYEN